MRSASTASLHVAPHVAARGAILALLLAACQQQSLPPPPPQTLVLPPVVMVPEYDETRKAVQDALQALDRNAQFKLAAAVASATDWKKHAAVWKALPSASPHKNDVPTNAYPDYWHIRREVAESIRATFANDPAFANFLATRQTEEWYWGTRPADALSCVSLWDLMKAYAKEHPEDAGARYHNAFLLQYVQEKNGDQAFPFYLW